MRLRQTFIILCCITGYLRGEYYSVHVEFVLTDPRPSPTDGPYTFWLHSHQLDDFSMSWSFIHLCMPLGCLGWSVLNIKDRLSEYEVWQKWILQLKWSLRLISGHFGGTSRVWRVTRMPLEWDPQSIVYALQQCMSFVITWLYKKTYCSSSVLS